jgi:hypothetical protein
MKLFLFLAAVEVFAHSNRHIRIGYVVLPAVIGLLSVLLLV